LAEGWCSVHCPWIKCGTAIAGGWNRFGSVIPPTLARAEACHPPLTLEECFMVLIDALLIVAMMFFLFLPITDRRTVQMKLCALCTLLVVFAATVTRTHVSRVQLAGIETTR
jgi:hypothetical protein